MTEEGLELTFPETDDDVEDGMFEGFGKTLEGILLVIEVMGLLFTVETVADTDGTIDTTSGFAGMLEGLMTGPTLEVMIGPLLTEFGFGKLEE
jgi:hypothetical protein